MLNINLGKNEAGQPVMLVAMQELADPLRILRAIKQQYPELWQKVHLEIHVPVNGARDAPDIIGK